MSPTARQDSDAARAAMRLHLTNSRERLRHAHEEGLRLRFIKLGFKCDAFDWLIDFERDGQRSFGDDVLLIETFELQYVRRINNAVEHEVLTFADGILQRIGNFHALLLLT